jgi:CRP/FNR family cyclic AMP-dependent transcriptional regulator
MDQGHSLGDLEKRDTLSVLGGNFSHEELGGIAKYMYFGRFKGGATVFREGDREAFMCIVSSGNINIVKGHGEDRQLLTTVGPGSIFGEMTLIDRYPRSATAIVADDATLLILDENDLERLITENPKLGVRLLYRLATLVSFRLRATTDTLVEYMERAFESH